MISAMIFAQSRDWTPDQVADHFGWRRRDVAKWFAATEAIRESRKQLIETAKVFGLSDSEAAVFSKI